MSVLNPNSDDEPQECPLCMEFLELDDINFYPCSCGYQVSFFVLEIILHSYKVIGYFAKQLGILLLMLLTNLMKISCRLWAKLY